ncbi:neuronal cell adhesion molecule-like isoform X1 [Panonychus citri]|uniref:neuronal cell adhesion molecule-like isoform X1 n=1 Tax=Panonychus citri TaxID=50023 RepID=UPI0023076061|nr:neuronal cell adhesion molecule-like isoform X1 [Panonychus citri]
MITFVIFSCLLLSCTGQESPKINPFSPLIKPLIGGKTSFACQALSGSLPFNILWFKNGVEIKELSSTRIRTSEDVSVLMIDSISSIHSGNYSCKISNRFGSDVYSIELKVEGPPFWNEKPVNRSIKYGESASVKCSASGFPKPKISWKIFKGSWINVESSDDSVIRVDGEILSISKAHSKHSGRYGCSITNGVQPNLWTEFNIDIDGI